MRVGLGNEVALFVHRRFSGGTISLQKSEDIVTIDSDHMLKVELPNEVAGKTPQKLGSTGAKIHDCPINK
ncbi:MAG: hypothetical protein GVY07_01735 [Bacteroidetes bacterium]|jgi:hypothetical protein|nr:hypothetical protein [Bacteroidota bacterium]